MAYILEMFELEKEFYVSIHSNPFQSFPISVQALFLNSEERPRNVIELAPQSFYAISQFPAQPFTRHAR